MNLTAPIVTIKDDYATRCKRVAIDPIYKRVVAGYETVSNGFEGTYFDKSWDPIPAASKQNIAIVSYPYDCKALFNFSEQVYMDYYAWK